MPARWCWGEKSMILATLRMVLPDNKYAEALQILKTVAEQCKIQRGSLGCRVYEDATNERAVMFEGKWTNEGT
jgi:hypothetical protein